MQDSNKFMYDNDKRKLLSGLAHGSIFLSSLVIPIAIPISLLLISDDPIVKDNCKEAINFSINVWIYGGIIALLAFTIIGLPLAWFLTPFLFLFHWVPPIFGILKSLSNPSESYRYPFIFHIL